MTLSRRTLVTSSLASLLSTQFALAQSRTVVIGQTVPWAGSLGELGQDIYFGARACFDETNAAGTLRGLKLELAMLDDSGHPHWAKANVDKLINNYGAIAVMGCVGASIAKAASTAAQSSGTPLWGMFCSTDIQGFTFRPSVQRQVTQLVKASIQNASQNVLVHYNDEFGKQDAVQAQAAISALVPGASISAIAINRDFPMIAAHIQQLASSKARSVILMVNAEHCAQASSALLSANIGVGSSVRLMATSESGGNQLLKMLGPKGDGTMVAVSVPHYTDAKRTIVRRYQNAMNKLKEGRQSFASFESYVYASALVEVLKTVRDPNAASLTAAAKKMERITVGDFSVTTDAKEAFVDIAVISSGRFRA